MKINLMNNKLLGIKGSTNVNNSNNNDKCTYVQGDKDSLIYRFRLGRKSLVHSVVRSLQNVSRQEATAFRFSSTVTVQARILAGDCPILLMVSFPEFALQKSIIQV